MSFCVNNLILFQLEAFQTPALKREVDRCRANIEEARLTCQHLEETLIAEKKNNVRVVEDEQARYRAEITKLIEQHHNNIIQSKCLLL